MRIEWATICKEIRETETGWDLLGVNQDTALVIGDLPTEIVIPLAVCIAARFDELGQEGNAHEVRCVVVGPDLSKVAANTERIRLEAPAGSHYEGWEGRLILPFAVAVPVTEGTFSFDVSADDSEAISLPYAMRLAPPMPE